MIGRPVRVPRAGFPGRMRLALSEAEGLTIYFTPLLHFL
jgi:hypothetical protein